MRWLGCLVVVALGSSALADPMTVGVEVAGPFATFDELVTEIQRDGSYAGETLSVDPTTANAAVLTLSGSGRKSSFLAIRTDRGWMVDRVLGDGYHAGSDPDWILHDNLRDTYLIVELVEHGPWVELHTIDARFVRRKNDERYYCVALEVVCRRDTASCSRPLPVGGQSECEPRRRTWTPSRWRDFGKLDWNHPIALHEDGTLTVPTTTRPRVPGFFVDLAGSLTTSPGTYQLSRVGVGDCKLPSCDSAR